MTIRPCCSIACHGSSGAVTTGSCGSAAATTGSSQLPAAAQQGSHSWHACHGSGAATMTCSTAACDTTAAQHVVTGSSQLPAAAQQDSHSCPACHGSAAATYCGSAACQGAAGRCSCHDLPPWQQCRRFDRRHGFLKHGSSAAACRGLGNSSAISADISTACGTLRSVATTTGAACGTTATTGTTKTTTTSTLHLGHAAGQCAARWRA